MATPGTNPYWENDVPFEFAQVYKKSKISNKHHHTYFSSPWIWTKYCKFKNICYLRYESLIPIITSWPQHPEVFWGLPSTQLHSKHAIPYIIPIGSQLSHHFSSKSMCLQDPFNSFGSGPEVVLLRCCCAFRLHHNHDILNQWLQKSNRWCTWKVQHQHMFSELFKAKTAKWLGLMMFNGYDAASNKLDMQVGSRKMLPKCHWHLACWNPRSWDELWERRSTFGTTKPKAEQIKSNISTYKSKSK